MLKDIEKSINLLPKCEYYTYNGRLTLCIKFLCENCSYGESYILWKSILWHTDPNFYRCWHFFYTFSTWLHLKTHIERVPIFISDTDTSIRIGYIKNIYFIWRDKGTAKREKNSRGINIKPCIFMNGFYLHYFTVNNVTVIFICNVLVSLLDRIIFDLTIPWVIFIYWTTANVWLII